MISEKDNLKTALDRYVSDTYDDITTIQFFTKGSDEWIKDREAEVRALEEVKDSEKELGGVLERTLKGLQEAQLFLDATERLAVTSAHVFQATLFGEDDQQPLCFHLHTAQILSSFLLLFKLDHEKFFRPEVLNNEVFQDHLQYLIKAVRSMCDGWKKSFLNYNSYRPVVHLSDLSEETMKQMLLQVVQLDTLRKDQSFRMAYLFGGKSLSFRDKFSEVKPQMQQIMLELEGCAGKLDSMNFGARISGTVGSSLGIAGGGLSIAGLIATPFTAGLSLILTGVGAGVGVVSGVQGIVTTSTEIGVNNTQTNKAVEAFVKCMHLMNELQRFLNDVILERLKETQDNHVMDYLETTYNGAVFADSVAGLISVIYKQVKSAMVAADAAHDAVEGTVAVVRVGTRASKLAKWVSVVSAGVNGVFAVVDGFFLYREIKGLVEGTETDMSKRIRARVSLWSTEIDLWQEIHNSLLDGEKLYEEYMEILNKPFVPL